MILTNIAQIEFIKKRELFNEVENCDRKVFTYCWVDRSLNEHCNQVISANIYPQEDPLLQAPGAYLDQYIEMVKQHIIGVIPDWSTI
jgi:hypothetical protein